MEPVGEVGGDGSPSSDLNIKIVTPDGELYGTFNASHLEAVEQFMKRLGLEREEDMGQVITLLNGDKALTSGSTLQDAGVVSGATLTLLRERQSQLQLTAFSCGHIYALDSFYSWIAEDGSPAAQFCSKAVAWCRRFAEDVQDGALAAVCTLQNPGWLQCLVDSGELSKSAAVQAVLASFIRSLLATGRLGNEGSGEIGAGNSSDHDVVVGILREKLPLATRGNNLMMGIKPHTTLTEHYLEYFTKKYPEKAATEVERVKANLAGAFDLIACEECEELPMNIWSDEQDKTVGLREFMQECTRKGACSGSDNDRWMSFPSAVQSPGSMCFLIKSDEEVYTFFPSGVMIYHFAAGVYLDGETYDSNTLPTHYVVQWARTD